ncbi:dipeptide ABC transporter ATP-binding protein [Rathayibacter sp. KR2-224]|uniref:dipeptide ABC transporter ATP-binding protein n=1 Tax=Rathayibacter sp. KR2-224 TaxID=3400913 RepID=UPI003C016AE9
MSDQSRDDARPAIGPVLDIRGLRVAYGAGREARDVLHGIDLSVSPGERVAVVGESGSGKSTMAAAALGLLASGGRITGGAVSIAGRDVTRFGDRDFRSVRGTVAGLVPQDPMVSLNPTLKIGPQIAEVIRRRGVPRRAVSAEVIDALTLAGIDDAVLRARQYPHELSGGLRQRALIAIALAGHPRLLIADEPTSALDATVQRRILDHLDRLVEQTGIGLLIITHDLGIAADRADQVVVMQNGRVVERGTPARVLAAPEHPYTKRLLDAAPAFAVPPATPLARPAEGKASVPLLELRGVSKEFRLPGRSPDGGPRHLLAVDDVSLSVSPGETLALVGESGSGKTTTLRIAMGLERPTSGTVHFDGADVSGLGWRALRPLRRRVQLVHQNPFASLDPKFSVAQIIAEPLEAFRIGDRASRGAAVRELLERVALPQSALDRRPAELSGGQRQRVAIARALALRPELVLLDEPVSALDVSVQAQILDLLGELQRELGLAYLVISHDLAVVSGLAHRVAVLGKGRVVESGPTSQVFGDPRHELTRELLAAIPGRRSVPA